MLRNLTSSLPIEYELKYGTACGDLDGTDFVSQAFGYGVLSGDVAFPKEKLLCRFWLNPSPLVVNRLDALLVPLDHS